MSTPKILLFSVLFFGAATLQAQTNFLKGYYVTTRGDTVHGFIEYRGSVKNDRSCSFRATPDSKTETIPSDEILGYAIENKVFYESHLVRNRKGEEFSGFFKVIIQGKLSLLSHDNKYFAKAPDGKIEDISRGSTIKKQNNSKKGLYGDYIVPDNYGLGMLKALMSDCGDMTGSYIEKAYTSEVKLVALFQRYNTCAGSTVSGPPEKLIRPQVALGLQISPTLTGLHLKSQTEAASFELDPGVSIGAVASVFFPRLDERMRLVVEATYAKYSSYAYFSSFDTSNDVFLDYSNVRFPLLGRFTMKRFFLELGVQNQVMLTQKSTWRVETTQQNVVLTSEEQFVPLNRWNVGFIAGVGVGFPVMKRQARTSVRFSQTYDLNHYYNPVFQILEFNLSMDLTK